MAGTTYKSLIGEEDLAILEDGAAETFERRTSTGGTVLLTKVGAEAIQTYTSHPNDVYCRGLTAGSGVSAAVATANTTILQAAINRAAITGRRVVVPSGHYKFTKLYFHYHATDNPEFPNVSGKRGKIVMTGAGKLQVASILAGATSYTGTVLESTDATGPALKIDGSGVGHQLTDLKLMNMTIVASNTTAVIDALKCNHFCGFYDLFVQQNGSGDGIEWEDVWVNAWRNVFVRGAGNTTSGIGLKIYATDLGGGNNMFYNVTVSDFAVGWQVGTYPYSASANVLQTVNCIGCQASGCLLGVRACQGTKSFLWQSSYVEQAEDGPEYTISSATTADPSLVTVTASGLVESDVVLITGTGESDLDDKAFYVYNVSGTTCNLRDLDNNVINGSGYGGAVSTGTITKLGRGMLVSGNALNTRIQSSWFGASDIGLQLGEWTSVAAEGAAVGVTVEDCNFNQSRLYGILTYSSTDTLNYLIRNNTHVAPGTGVNIGPAYHLRLFDGVHHGLTIINPYYVDADTVLTADALNYDHADLYALETTWQFNTTARGDITRPQFQFLQERDGAATVAPVLFKQVKNAAALLELETDVTPGADYLNVNTTAGDGAVVGPQAKSSADGWLFAKMVQVSLVTGAGTETVYVATYTADPV